MNPSSYYGNTLPIDISTHGKLIDQLFWLMHGFMAVLFVFWFGYFVYTVYRFRQRPGHRANYAPKYTKASTWLEVGIALFEAAVLVVLAMPAWKFAKASIPTGKDRFEVHVVAEQFAWNIHYPGEDGVFGKTDPKLITTDNPIGLDPSDPASKDDITTINQLHVPVNRPVVALVRSKDVIHNFYLPVVRVKQDVVPGMTFPVWFQATQTGDFEIACAQLCGLGHYRMKGYFVVQKEDELKAWLKEQKASSGE